MINDTSMIIDIPFNVIEHPFWFEFKVLYSHTASISQTKDWIDYRVDIFMKYTAKSLINQTNQNFKCIVRHTTNTKSLILDALSKYPQLPDNILFTDDGDSTIKEIISGYKYIYHIRIDSDNMFSPDYIEKLHNIKYYNSLECILSQQGYMYHTKENILAHMHHPSPSFYALVYTVENFLLGLRYYVKDDHWGAAAYNHEIVQTPSYMIIIHELNISNNFHVILEYPYIKTWLATNHEKDEVLKFFNLN